ncbi:hypothetical protein HBB16_11705 [Pseudonocardia sp. MCCB 268]|nr:hypothetical protein [Pseudonocardia cytotoxica]
MPNNELGHLSWTATTPETWRRGLRPERGLGWPEWGQRVDPLLHPRREPAVAGPDRGRRRGQQEVRQVVAVREDSRG